MLRARRCSVCGSAAHFRCRSTGEFFCLGHASLEVTARRPSEPGGGVIVPAEPRDYADIAALADHFWGETEVHCFDKTYDITALPAYVARVGKTIVGALSFAIESGQLIIVLLNVLPDFQGQGYAARLIEAAVGEAKNRGLSRLSVATSNDDLPALYVYQRNGFTITGARLGEILRHHGGEETGFAGIPVRDELRLAHLI